jgi:hypothetical protein
MMDEKVFIGLHDIFIIYAHVEFYKCMTWLTNQEKDTKSGQRCALMWVYIKKYQALM